MQSMNEDDGFNNPGPTNGCVALPLDCKLWKIQTAFLSSFFHNNFQNFWCLILHIHALFIHLLIYFGCKINQHSHSDVLRTAEFGS